MSQTGVDSPSNIEFVAKSDVGLRRANNQDSYVVVPAAETETWQRRGHVFIVADGMGAHAAGELASKLAVDTIPHTYHKLVDKPVPLALKQAVVEANRIIFNRGQANPDFQGMGTTTSALILLPSGAIVAHVGDSRVYRLRGQRLEQLSFDHSLLWELTAGGQQSEVAQHIPKNIITRSLGPNADVEIDLEGPFPVAAGDTFLLCSDGLSGEVSDEEIGAVLAVMPPEEAVQALIDLANLRGGPDNITIVVARALADMRQNGSESFAAELPGARRGMHPGIWAALAVAIIVGGGLAVWHPLAGAIAAVVGLASLFLLHSWLRPEDYNVAVGQLGRGPHGTWDCTPGLPFIERLQGTLAQLRTAATEEDWTIDWNEVDGLDRRARAATEAGDYRTALRDYCRAVSFMMRELKKNGTHGRLGDLGQGTV